MDLDFHNQKISELFEGSKIHGLDSGRLKNPNETKNLEDKSGLQVRKH